MKAEASPNPIAIDTICLKTSRLTRRSVSIAHLSQTETLSADTARTIERYFESPQATILKDDHFSTVILLESKDRFVIKKEHPGTALKFLRKTLRKSRAAKAWANGLLLTSRGLPTIVPLALIEDYCFLLRIRSFLVSAYIRGSLYDQYLTDPDIPFTQKEATAIGLIDMLHHWHQLGITHGDPKAANIIISDNKLSLIDPENVKYHRLSLLKRRAIARDWSIVLHNWQKIPQIREMALPRILLLLDSDRRKFAARLIRKLWKSEHTATGWFISAKDGIPRPVIELTSGKTPPGWIRQTSRAGLIRAVCLRDDSQCILSSCAFPRAGRKNDYFGKKRLPARGILSIAFSLRICGFNLPEIMAGGLYDGYEYLMFNDSKLFSCSSALESDQTDITRMIQQLGTEIGRFHALGFIHDELFLDNIRLRIEGNRYLFYFALNGRIRWTRGTTGRGFDKDLQTIKQEIVSRLSENDAANFFTAYHLERRRG